jgi:hypothetical protein
MVGRFQKFLSMIMCNLASISLCFFPSIVSLPLIYNQNILKGVPSKNSKYTFEASRDLIDTLYLFYQNQFPYLSFEKLNMHFDFKNNLVFI